MTTIEALAVAADVVASVGDGEWPFSWTYALQGDLVAIGVTADIAAAAVVWEDSVGDDGSAP